MSRCSLHFSLFKQLKIARWRNLKNDLPHKAMMIVITTRLSQIPVLSNGKFVLTFGDIMSLGKLVFKMK